MRYAIGPLRLDPRTRILSRGDLPLALGPRVVGTLEVLVARRGEVVTKDELLDAVWGDDDVTESNVAQTVYVLRKTLREHGIASAIATVPRRGYRFTGDAHEVSDARPASPPPPARAPRWAGVAAAALLLAAAVPATPTASPGASLSPRGAELYRLGRYFWSQRTVPALRESARLFGAVVRTDPRSPLGYSGIADADLMLIQYAKVEGVRVDRDALTAEARGAVAGALRLAPGSAVAHTSLGMLLATSRHDKPGAEAEFRRAIALDPAYPIAHHWYGTLLLTHDRVAEAERELRQAVALDPASPAANAWLGSAAYYRGRYDDAIVYEERALALEPARGDALRALGLAYEQRGDVGRAIAAFRALARLRGWPVTAAALLAEAYARSGRTREAVAELRVAQRTFPDDADTRFAEVAVAGPARARGALAKVRVQDPHEPRLARYANG